MMAGQRSSLEGPALFRHPLSAAVIAVIAERGFQAASIEEFVARAGVDRAEFDRLFAGKDDAALRVFEAYIDDFQTKAKLAFESSPKWPDSLRAAAYATTRWIRDYPDGTHFGMVSAIEIGEMARVRREKLFRWCAELIDAGRAVAPEPDAVPQGASLMAIGAIIEILSRQVQGTIEADPVEMVPEMMYSAVRPYLGEAAARRELTIPPPPDLLPPDP